MPKKELVGKVVSNKMQKTVVVAVGRSLAHDKYEKQRIVTGRFKAHDENNQCQVGDTVKIIESKPISKDKHWIVIENFGNENLKGVSS